MLINHSSSEQDANNLIDTEQNMSNVVNENDDEITDESFDENTVKGWSSEHCEDVNVVLIASENESDNDLNLPLALFYTWYNPYY